MRTPFLARLVNERREEILQRIATGESRQSIAEWLGTDARYLRRLLIAEGIGPGRPGRRSISGVSRTTSELTIVARAMHASGATRSAIAKRLGVTYSRVWQVLR